MPTDEILKSSCDINIDYSHIFFYWFWEDFLTFPLWAKSLTLILLECLCEMVILSTHNCYIYFGWEHEN